MSRAALLYTLYCADTSPSQPTARLPTPGGSVPRGCDRIPRRHNGTESEAQIELLIVDRDPP